MNRNCLKVYTESPWKLEGDYWMAPATLIVEGVHCGSGGCQLWTGDVIKSMADKWHNCPVCKDHPYVGNAPVSVNHSEQVYRDHVVGVVEKPSYDPISRSLRATIRVPQGITGLEQIMLMKEVSVGVFTNNVQEEGHFNGKRYVGRTTKADPDHLALLSGPGACDWSAGCGVRPHGYSEIDELRAIAGQTIKNWVNETLQEARIMHDYKDQAVLPAEVYAANQERDDLATLKSWEGDESPPQHILELRQKYATNKPGQDWTGQGYSRGKGYADQAVIPPEIV